METHTANSLVPVACSYGHRKAVEDSTKQMKKERIMCRRRIFPGKGIFAVQNSTANIFVPVACSYGHWKAVEDSTKQMKRKESCAGGEYFREKESLQSKIGT
ncbi:hypothetical protein CEXT_508671 [Caerostris extrusa]|uniref:Uncharacterized protein n=1 Tax=Caerostris extrusa TaxID=172846 RepID=A0AAV4T7G7_CAEEX|nr:hypothetical protein CEXT_508671 [Caerostris extrusa]